MDEKTEFLRWDNSEGRPFEVNMTAVESEPFGKYTPSGSITMLIKNDAASAQFIPGKEYIVRFEMIE